MKQSHLIILALLCCAVLVGGVGAVDIEYTYGTATDSTHDGAHTAAALFDHVLGGDNRWDAIATFTRNTSGAWAKQDYGSGAARVINKYSMYWIFNNNLYYPITWTVDGSNNDSTWTTLDFQTGHTSWNTAWYNFTMSNSVSYRYYRIYITEANNGEVAYFGEWNLLYSPPPIASFTTNTTSGNAPLAVLLTDTSTNTPTSWAWNATNVTGNNVPFTFSTIQNATYSFPTGNYTISLNATNAVGSNVSAQVTWVNVTRALQLLSQFLPVVNQTGTAPYNVQFFDTSAWV